MALQQFLSLSSIAYASWLICKADRNPIILILQMFQGGLQIERRGGGNIFRNVLIESTPAAKSRLSRELPVDSFFSSLLHCCNSPSSTLVLKNRRHPAHFHILPLPQKKQFSKWVFVLFFPCFSPPAVYSTHLFSERGQQGKRAGEIGHSNSCC